MSRRVVMLVAAAAVVLQAGCAVTTTNYADRQIEPYLQIYAAQPVSSGVKLSDSYTQQAREAGRRGDHQKAQLYHGLSAASLRHSLNAGRPARLK